MGDGGQVEVRGLLRDQETRCEHYHSEVDIIAIKFRCCRRYFACYQCHAQLESHPSERWTAEQLQHEKVVLCGKCRNELLFKQYSEHGGACLFCRSRFNPGCALHYDIYFDFSRGT